MVSKIQHRLKVSRDPFAQPNIVFAKWPCLGANRLLKQLVGQFVPPSLLNRFVFTGVKKRGSQLVAVISRRRADPFNLGLQLLGVTFFPIKKDNLVLLLRRSKLTGTV